MTAGAPAKARTYFEEVVTEFPKHPAAPSAMLALAPLYIEEKAFPEAIKVLRKALTYPLDKSVKLEAYRRVGGAFYSAGEQAAAIEAFNAAVKADPELVFKEPVVLRYLGEAMFVEQKYDESRDKMFRCLNLRFDAPDRDLGLARIAEILTLQDEKDLADPDRDPDQGRGQAAGGPGRRGDPRVPCPGALKGKGVRYSGERIELKETKKK